MCGALSHTEGNQKQQTLTTTPRQTAAARPAEAKTDTITRKGKKRQKQTWTGKGEEILNLFLLKIYLKLHFDSKLKFSKVVLSSPNLYYRTFKAFKNSLIIFLDKLRY